MRKRFSPYIFARRIDCKYSPNPQYFTSKNNVDEFFGCLGKYSWFSYDLYIQ